MLCPSCAQPVLEQHMHCSTCGWLLTPHLPPGTLLHQGKYQVERVLGQGGFGITYLGQHLSLRQGVALKELFPQGSGRGTNGQVIPQGAQEFQMERARCLEEARTLGLVQHPSVVRVLDVFEENNTVYLVMEHLPGQSLGALLLDHGPRSPEQVTRFAVQLLDALKELHAHGLLHRDIKPENVILTPAGRVVLIDFGTARAFDVHQTSNHTRLVTPGYAPLEQYATAARVGPFTDFYALAATLLHLLTGVVPVAATDRAAGVSLGPLPAHLPLGLKNMLEAALKLSVQERPQCVDDMLRLLNNPWVDIQNDSPPALGAEELYQQALKLIPERRPRAAEKLLLAAEMNHLQAQTALADLLVKGFHKDPARRGPSLFTPDLAGAERWYRKAAEQGHTPAQIQLGWMHMRGQCTPSDLKEGVRWFQTAADRGDLVGLNNLAWCHEQGFGVDRKNLPLAFTLYLQAAQAGLGAAQGNVGRFHYDGKAVKRNHKEALVWFQKGGNQQDPWSLFNLGQMHELGEGGLKRDRETAKTFYEQAAQLGLKAAHEKLERMRSRWYFM